MRCRCPKFVAGPRTLLVATILLWTVAAGAVFLWVRSHLVTDRIVWRNMWLRRNEVRGSFAVVQVGFGHIHIYLTRTQLIAITSSPETDIDPHAWPNLHLERFPRAAHFPMPPPGIFPSGGINIVVPIWPFIVVALVAAWVANRRRGRFRPRGFTVKGPESELQHARAVKTEHASTK